MTPGHFPGWEYQEDLWDLSTDSLILLASSVDGGFKLNIKGLQWGSTPPPPRLAVLQPIGKNLSKRRSSLRTDPRHHIHTHTKEKTDRNLKYYHKQNQGENIPLHFVFIQEGILRHHDFFFLSVSV